jgi:integrase
MTETEPNWERVANAIETRMAERQMIRADVIRASGVSETSLRNYLSGAPIVAMLGWHRAAMGGRAERLGVKVGAKAFVFSDDGTCGRSWNPDTVTKRWQRHVTAAGHPGVRVHDLRHAMATAWLDAGVPLHVVAQRLGHAKASTTSDI